MGTKKASSFGEEVLLQHFANPFHTLLEQHHAPTIRWIQVFDMDLEAFENMADSPVTRLVNIALVRVSGCKVFLDLHFLFEVLRIDLCPCPRFYHCYCLNHILVFILTL
eukprot:TRINITY_DN2576_c0_g1_i8.p1 TRINITY_DN2576_c0_g1~~TRINITY_DN2576_c0_g1_i8.p1  ORF type:complete len:109 (+),score=0.76 TRINITY_DN2576_c0_g1_i8:261-587(+)